MPIRIPENLPAIKTLEKERIFFMQEGRAAHQDIRPLEIAILNLMPDKIRTETQLLRTLSYSPLQLDITFLRTASYESKNTASEHLVAFYKNFEDVKDKRFDALIITGAPVETMPYEDVQYWPELQTIFDWSQSNVFSSFFICWGAQAALHHFHGITKHETDGKQFGVYQHDTLDLHHPLLRGFDDHFHVPVSRHTEIKEADIKAKPELQILASSTETGPCLIHEENARRVYMFNHLEYDPANLRDEYERDVKAGLEISVPANYYRDDNPENPPVVMWRSHRNLLFANWINMVYQDTPYDLADLP
jgi:homoserine O-succinyltransferase